MAKSIWLGGAAVIAMTGLGAPSASAQEDGAGERGGDTIVVTARKREENLQDVPLSVTALSEEFIDNANLFDISDLSAFTPGFQQQQAFGRDGDRPVIRGTSNILISEGKVGIFVDGIPFIGDTSALDLNSFERIEIIRGPQSAIFGRGTLSGAINYVTKKGSDELTGRFEGTVAEWSEYEVFGSLSGPIIEDRLFWYASAKYFETGGDRTNGLTGNHLGQSSTTVNAGLRFTPSDNVELGLRYIFTEDDDDHFPIALQDSSFNNCQFGSRGYFCGEVEFPDVLELNTDDLLAPGLSREAHRLFADMDWDIAGSGYTLSGLFGYTDLTERSGTDQTYDGTTALFITSPFVCAVVFDNCVFGASPFNTDGEAERESWSGELRLSSPASDRLRWQLGVFYFENEVTPTTFGLKQTEFGFDSIGERDEVRNVAVFGGLEFDVTDRLTAGVELRYGNDRIRTMQAPSFISGDLIPGATDPNVVVEGGGSDRSETFESVTPRFTLDYQLNDNVLLYGVVSQGNAPGGFNGEDAPTTTFDEETLWNYEIGFKSRLADRLTLNVSGFFIDYSDQVLTSTFTTGAGGVDSFRDNVGDTEIWGIELETFFDVTENFTLAGTYSLTDAEIVNGLNEDQAILFGGPGCDEVDFVNNDVILPAGTIIGDGTALAEATPCSVFADLSGQTAPLVSKHQASISAAYDAPFFNTGLDWFLRTDLTYRSSFYAQVHNLIETGDATRVNFTGGFRKDGVTLRFWLRNAFNNDTPNGILRYVDFQAPDINGFSPRAFAITPSEKRQVGVTLTAQF